MNCLTATDSLTFFVSTNHFIVSLLSFTHLMDNNSLLDLKATFDPSQQILTTSMEVKLDSQWKV